MDKTREARRRRLGDLYSRFKHLFTKDETGRLYQPSPEEVFEFIGALEKAIRRPLTTADLEAIVARAIANRRAQASQEG